MASVETLGYPRLCEGLAIVPASDGLVIEGAPRRQALRGVAATDLLPRLLPLLDGRHHRTALRLEVGLGEGQLNQVLDLLDGAGLLDRIASKVTGGRIPSQVMTYLSRTISETGGYRSSDTVAEALTGSAVHLIGTAEFVRPVLADLSEVGVGAVTSTRPADLPQRMENRAGSAVMAGLVEATAALVVVEDAAGLLEEAIATFGGAEVPVMRVARPHGCLEIGPMLLPGHPVCSSCLRRALRRPPWTVDQPDAPSHEACPGAGDLHEIRRAHV